MADSQSWNWGDMEVDRADNGSASGIIPYCNISKNNLSGDDVSNDGLSDSTSDTSTLLDVGELLGLFLDFAQWAFGPKGFPALQILAIGDFSYQGRYSEYNHLLCRETSWTSPASHDSIEQGVATDKRTWRSMTKKDGALWDLFNENAAFFNACPTDPIVQD
jgi:hypothetical protein